ncbi:MAG: glutathione S-transferase family protein [Ramlibacter sp.]
MSAAGPLLLVSHPLCPYVQRAAIVLSEKGVPFTRRTIDLADKPDWFLAVSPLGKTPVLLVGKAALFESAVICEYLDDTLTPQLHPRDALERARHRAWMEFGSSVLNTIAAFYNAPDARALQLRRDELRARFTQLEDALPESRPYFAGPHFGMVDAVFGPVFRYLDVFEQAGEASLVAGLPRVEKWREALAQRPSVREAVSASYRQLLLDFLRARGSELSRRLSPPVPAL